MASTDFGTGKSMVVLCIVIGCFAVLWPKIFYPMMQTAFAMTSPNIDSDDPSYQDTDHPPHLHPGSINPRLRKTMPSDIEDKFHMREGRPFPHPTARNPGKIPHKTGGAMSIIMPIYTIGIIVFFLYTVLKLVFKKPQEEEEKKPLIKDFHMDAKYKKFMCDQPQDKNKKNDVKIKTCKADENNIPEKEAKVVDPKDFEIYKLRKKLEETEEAMDRIMKHMGAMSASLSGMDQTIFSGENGRVKGDEVRQRHKKLKKNCESPTSKKDMADLFSNEKRQKLQEDLAQAMRSAAQITRNSNCENDGKHLDECEVRTDTEEESSENELNDDGVEFILKDDKKKAHIDACYSDQCGKLSPSEKAL